MRIFERVVAEGALEDCREHEMLVITSIGDLPMGIEATSAQIDLVLRTLRQLGLTLRVDLVNPVSSSLGIDLGEIIRSTTKQV